MGPNRKSQVPGPQKDKDRHIGALKVDETATSAIKSAARIIPPQKWQCRRNIGPAHTCEMPETLNGKTNTIPLYQP